MDEMKVVRITKLLHRDIIFVRPHRSWGPPRLLCKWVPGLLPYPLPSSAGAKERVDLYLCTHSGSSWPGLANFTFTVTLHIQLQEGIM